VHRLGLAEVVRGKYNMKKDCIFPITQYPFYEDQL
jgi:hypothetical protein